MIKFDDIIIDKILGLRPTKETSILFSSKTNKITLNKNKKKEINKGENKNGVCISNNQ